MKNNKPQTKKKNNRTTVRKKIPHSFSYSLIFFQHKTVLNENFHSKHVTRCEGNKKKRN